MRTSIQNLHTRLSNTLNDAAPRSPASSCHNGTGSCRDSCSGRTHASRSAAIPTERSTSYHSRACRSYTARALSRCNRLLRPCASNPPRAYSPSVGAGRYPYSRPRGSASRRAWLNARQTRPQTPCCPYAAGRSCRARQRGTPGMWEQNLSTQALHATD